MPKEPDPKPRWMAVWLQPAAWLLLVVLALFFFSHISVVVMGILAASIIACTLYPLMTRIPGPHAIRLAAVGIGLLAAVGIGAFALSYPLAKPLGDAFDNWPQTQREINDSLAKWSTALALDKPLRFEELMSNVGDFLAGPGGQQLFSRSADLLLGVLISLAFTLIGSIFLLSEPPGRIIDPALRLLAPRHRPIMQRVLEELAPRYRRWVIGTFTGMCIVFTASLIGYKSIGLKLAVPLAILAGLAEIVPTVGPAMACLVALLFAAATQGAAMVVGVLIVYGIIQAVEAYVILPLIMRGAVKIHPAVTLFSVVLWGKIFGIPGLMMAIPINLTIWTLLHHFRIRPQEEETGDSHVASARADHQRSSA